MASQTDIFRDDPRRVAQAYREAAESALLNPFEDPARRQARHDHYTAEATRLEATAWPVTNERSTTMNTQRGESTIQMILVIVVVAFLLLGGVGSCMWGYPKYKVYSMEMHGKAVLAEAESSREVAVREALALKDSAVHKADAERIRAQGVADANEIVSGSLGGPEGYLRYLAIESMRAQAESPNSSTIYVPTEAGIPITEASRFNKPVQAVQE